MLLASRLAERLGRIDAGLTERQRRLLAAWTSPPSAGCRSDLVLKTMMHDKKVQHGKLRFVLPSGLGQVDLVGDVSAEQVRAVLAR